MAIYSGDDRRRFVPLAMREVLTALIDDEPQDPSLRRAELRSLRSRLCLLYGMADPAKPANEASVLQDLAEEDGDAVSD